METPYLERPYALERAVSNEVGLKKNPGSACAEPGMCSGCVMFTERTVNDLVDCPVRCKRLRKPEVVS